MAKYKINDKVTHNKFGNGFVKQFDKKNLELYALIEFDDGCRIWFPKWQFNKEVKPIGKTEESRGI